MPRKEDSLVSVTTDARGRAQKLVLRAAALRVTSGPSQGRQMEIDRSPLLIGTHGSCDLRLEDPTVSSRHAELAFRPGGYLLRDLGSRNGILLGGYRVEQLYLSPGMSLTLGRSTIVVIDLDRRVEVPLSRADRFGELVGRSVAMRDLFAQLEAAARSDSTVLLEGETGTGKELTAEALHQASGRAEGPFEVFDCAAIPSGLAESELFGHVKGAFTGADTTRAGALERAHGGTLFLDEIGELPLALQPKLLRAIESRRFTPVGGSSTRSVDVRFIAATHRSLDHEVRKKAFREDLYYRLAVVRIRVPPLRERIDDLPLLIERLARASGQEGVADRLLGVTPLLQSYTWPGNVRELRNVVERLGVLPIDEALPSAVFGRERPSNRASLASFVDARDRALDQFERNYLIELLKATSGNITQAATIAQVSRRYLTRLVAKHRLQGQGRGARGELEESQ
jgi:DNA-binding NtrC family response regulator